MIYDIQYWGYVNDNYEDFEIKVEASNDTDALQIAKDKTRNSKNFKILKRYE